jgi:hypothetical protein
VSRCMIEYDLGEKKSEDREVIIGKNEAIYS